MSATATAIVGVLSGSGGAGISGFIFRKRTTAETSSIMATAAETLVTAAAALASSSDARIKDLERRLTLAEQASVLAHQAAMQARESEGRCLRRLEEMQAQIDELRALALAPTTTTTVTTAVTTQEALTP